MSTVGFKRMGASSVGLGTCNGLKWVKENQERVKDTRHRWKDKCVGGHTNSVLSMWDSCEL